MAITELVFPTSGTPTVPTDYAYQNGYLAQNAKGYNAVSLTNWDATTTAPQVESGSAIEVNGATWQVDADTTIVTTGASSGTVYVVFDDATPEFKITDTAPTWSAPLNGWYTAGDRFTGHLMTWDGASSYSSKTKYAQNKSHGDAVNISPDGNVDLETVNKINTAGWTGSYTSKTFGATETWVIPAGAYMLATNSGVRPLFEIYSGSSWEGEDTEMQGFIVSDGVNYRLSTSGSAAIIVYRKIW